MCSDHLPNRICVDQTSEENEGYEVVVQDFGVEVEVSWDKGPGYEEGDEAEECTAGLVASGTAGSDNIDGAE